MKKSRYTEEQIAFGLKQAEVEISVDEVCRKMGISQATFYSWRKKIWRVRPFGITPPETIRGGE
ncbi:Transposase [Mycoavidus cysteinexigens]|uniref:Transposase n=1 Tax=Mycoavidus cysteinexigens TaxID=1553431 RepID=A0A2Z6EU67_9BURK|nr:Transposase [Mycoavidus cysteinexigens]GLR01204.1 hypothetical protein GCM10007934_10160 [Mycoavidus cysteinexigens]